MTGGKVTQIPDAIVEKVESVGMLESIPLWIVTLDRIHHIPYGTALKFFRILR